ncbi:hypothetical protein CAPGI0001_0278 [Capnocytophaga gingivalis ATCC 33624]|uniref:hypothetical protein n=1 Tax=Capnocytophaga gingivalis TaxID=1017 RepID=UPI00019FABE9|nr:hypothetical protein [Capnocytophaga gingivalis]EEK13648.1 hypothetical protein CAPGI0001_0278 [Capnocytophaga gingivalis ATCC 33624]
MGGKDTNYQVVYRGETLPFYRPGGYVFFQRSKESGGGYWLGRTYDDCFIFEIEKPISLAYGLDYLLCLEEIQRRATEFIDEYDPNYTLF